jgi:hypothetical protein
MSAPPPLPLPPSAPSSEKSTQQPTFLEKFIQANLSPKQEFIVPPCLIPERTPEDAFKYIDPMLSLETSDFFKDELASKDIAELPQFRTAVQDFTQLLSLCGSYKHTADANQKEAKYKHKRWNLNKQKKKVMQQSEEDANEKLTILENKLSKLKPPPHSEYTPLTIDQNYYLSQINSVNYRLCLAYKSCPARTKEYVSCLEGIDEKEMDRLAEKGLGSMICLEERQALERCVGLGVERVVKEILR